MDTIRTYIETMFLKLPDTAETRKAREELLTMMEDKYQELKTDGKGENEAIGTVIAEFGNLEDLAQELGIDLLNGETPLVSQQSEPVDHEESGQMEKILVKLDEAKSYVRARTLVALESAAGVMLCIWSVMFPQFFGEKGVVLMFAAIALGVGIPIISDFHLTRYRHLRKKILILESEAEQWIAAQKERMASRSMFFHAGGVMLLIVSILPPVITEELWRAPKGSLEEAFGDSMFFFLIGVGVFLLLYYRWRMEAFYILLQTGDYAIGKNTRTMAQKMFGALYWPLVTIIYLAWSFWTREWDITWIIWPLAAIAGESVDTLLGLIGKRP